MADLEEFLAAIEDEIKTIQSSDFKVEVTSTTDVPTADDRGLTYPNLDEKRLKCKSIETCVLYIDIRKSTDLNLSKRPQTLSKLYSSFIRSMARGAEFCGGKVRNIIGDRLMVVFPGDENCYIKAYVCAMLYCNIGYRINRHFKGAEFEWGIGIDYGKMLVTKAGIIKNGQENSNYKSLVWLGPPANIASKLTDQAGKKQFRWSPTVNDYVSYTASRILMTERVFKGLPEEMRNNLVKQQGIHIPQYTGYIYGDLTI